MTTTPMPAVTGDGPVLPWAVGLDKIDLRALMADLASATLAFYWANAPDALEQVERALQRHRAQALATYGRPADGGPTLYLAEYESLPPELFPDVESAKELCADCIVVEVSYASGRCGWDWAELDGGVLQQVWTDPDTDRRLGDGPGRVTPLRVQSGSGDALVVSGQAVRDGR